ncbi:unnamed protein product [marine sediment metagenome]|uniref:Uncharacterized protein n=1 Tax=marine sediment metagenome TaxID=412755 RepID=X1MCI6_9ZZZZ
MKEKLAIDSKVLNEVNKFLTKKSNPVIDEIIKIVNSFFATPLSLTLTIY